MTTESLWKNTVASSDRTLEISRFTGRYLKKHLFVNRIVNVPSTSYNQPICRKNNQKIMEYIRVGQVEVINMSS